MHALSLYPFFLICCSLSIPISIPISEHKSILPLGHKHRSIAPIRQDSSKHRSTNTDLPSSDPQASIRSDQIRSDQDLPSSDPQAPIVPISTDLSLCCLSIWVCLCVGVFVYFCVFFFWAIVSLCGCVCVHLRKKKKMRRGEVTRRKEREKKERVKLIK